MESDKISDLIIQYLVDDMSPTERSDFENLLKNNPLVEEELKIHQQVFTEWRKLKVTDVPPERIQYFNNWLENEVNSTTKKTTKIRRLPNILKYAVAACFIIFSIFFTRWYLQQQTGHKLQIQRDNLLQLVSAENTTSRIKGINQYQNHPTLDPQIRDVFIRVLSNDKSINVRLAALEALSGLSGDTQVKETLIRILETDDEPAIQMAIINVLVQWKDSYAKETLQDLLSRDQVPDDVKEEAFLGVTRL